MNFAKLLRTFVLQKTPPGDSFWRDQWHEVILDSTIYLINLNQIRINVEVLIEVHEFHPPTFLVSLPRTNLPFPKC